MKTHILFIFVLFVLNSSLYSQNTFDFILKGEQDQIPGLMVEDNEGNIILPIWNNHYAQIIKISNIGEFIDSVEISNPADGKCNLFTTLKTDNNQFYSFGNYETDSTYSFWFTKFDTDLNLIIDSKFPVAGSIVSVYCYSIINSIGNIVSVMPYEISSYHTEIIIFEISPDGQLINFKNLGNQGTGIIGVYDLIQVSSNEYRIYTSSSLQKAICYCNVLNADLEVVDSYTVPWYLGDLTTVRNIDDNSLIIAGKKTFAKDDYQLGIIKTDLNNNLQVTNSFGKIDTVDFPGIHNNLDFVETNNMFYAGTSNLNVINPYFSTFPTWFILNKLDSDLNLQWQKFYGGDACYNLWTILATQDGGCIMAGSKYDSQIQVEERDAYILKVDGNGMITWTQNIPEVTNEVLIYPNPGQNVLNIRTLKKNLTFKLYNSFALKVFEEKISNYSFRINTSDLISGTYYYRITNKNNELIETGKWIKK